MTEKYCPECKTKMPTVICKHCNQEICDACGTVIADRERESEVWPSG